MSIGADIILAGISAIFSGLMTAILSLIAWKGKGTLGEINKNTKFRRLMVGDEEFERDEGELEQIEAQFDRMRAERQQEHAETREKLEEIEEGMGYLTQFVRNIASAFNRSELDDTISEPDEYDRPGTWRGGSPEESDD